jgi:hypothetical protein
MFYPVNPFLICETSAFMSSMCCDISFSAADVSVNFVSILLIEI